MRPKQNRPAVRTSGSTEGDDPHLHKEDGRRPGKATFLWSLGGRLPPLYAVKGMWEPARSADFREHGGQLPQLVFYYFDNFFKS